MASRQRRRGQPVKFWARKLEVDRRGNEILRADVSRPPDYVTTAASFPQRSARAEVPGQQQIDIVRLIVTKLPEDAGIWAICEWRGDYWDVVAPPAYRQGTRHTEHWSVDIRRRPDKPDGAVP